MPAGVFLASGCRGAPDTSGARVRPLTVDSLLIGMGERYDVIVTATEPGVWPIVVAAVEAQLPPARALLRYTDAAPARPPAQVMPEGVERGRSLDLGDLRGPEASGMKRPDRTFDLSLSSGMMMSPGWTIDGQRYPDAESLEISAGERVRVRMTNHSMLLHPMHLHGHFFRVAQVIKDTVLVPPHMGRVTFDFRADNPGNWFFHCHNIYHMEAGMARVFRYV